MILIRDTREQSKLLFPSEIEVIDKKLDFGDYGCELSDGHFVPIVHERKSINDIFGTLGQGYDRFKREIIRCQEAKFRMILLIEGTLTKVGKGIKHSARNPDSLLDQIFTLFVRYKIIPVFAKDPTEASRWITLFYSLCYRDWETDRKSTRLNSSHSAKSRMPSSA